MKKLMMVKIGVLLSALIATQIPTSANAGVKYKDGVWLG